MPLSELQQALAKLLAVNRSQDSYLAGGAAILIEPNTNRYSNDLDYFQDSVERVAEAFEQDRSIVTRRGYLLSVQIKQPGYIRALVEKADQATKVEWAHDSAWRFMPTVAHPDYGYLLHPIDLAINKLLAVLGRDEPRDFLDLMYVHHNTLALGPLAWAAAGKDPGFTPLSILGLLGRRGKYRPEDFARLHLNTPVDLQALKRDWLAALNAAENFIRSQNPAEVGCLYYDTELKRFVNPQGTTTGRVLPHYGRPGGVLPRIIEG